MKSEPPRIRPRDHGHAHAQAHARHTEGVAGSSADLLDLATIGKIARADAELAAMQAGLEGVLRAEPFDVHPDPRALRARRAVAAHLSTSIEQILLGNGASELAWTCGAALARADAATLIVMPGPSELAAGARARGSRVVQWRAVERTGHAVDLEQVRDLITLEGARLAYLGAPAWPSGAQVAFEAVQLMAAQVPDCTIVVDQGELELSEQHAELSHAPAPNVVCLRSVGTSLGVPGIRVGYLWGRAELCAFLDGRRPSFNTSCLAQRAAELWSGQTEFISRRRSRLLADRDRVATLLSDIGLAPTPSVTGAVLVRVTRAAEVAEELLTRHAIAVCDCAAYGLPDHLRISGVDAADAPRLRQALAEVLERRGIPSGREK